MSRTPIFQSLESNGLVNADGTPGFVPIASYHSNPLAKKGRRIVKKNAQGAWILFIAWNMRRIKNLGDFKPLCDDVFEIIMHFTLGVSPVITGCYQDSQGELIPVSKQIHLISWTLFRLNPNEPSNLIFHNLMSAVKNADLKLSEEIIASYPNYLLMKNNDGITPLAMALCTDNHIMVEMMEKYFVTLDDGKSEMLRQFNDVFPQGYKTHCTQQKVGAKKLFIDASIINKQGKCILFNGVSSMDIDNVLNQVPDTDSVLRQRLKQFKELLTNYYKTNLYKNAQPIHNDDILYLADELYAEYFSSRREEAQCKVFSYRIIGQIQNKDKKMFLFRLKNHMQGMVKIYRHNDWSNSFLDTTEFDVDSLNCLGVDCCISLYGHLARHRQFLMTYFSNDIVTRFTERRAMCRYASYCMATKNKLLSETMQRCQTQSKKPGTCCVM